MTNIYIYSKFQIAPKSDSRKPYFYIIQHTPSGKLYVGSKYGKDANSETFMVEGGYYTSSNLVKNLIITDGLDSFKIVQLITEDVLGVDVLYWETTFLQSNKIAQRKNWLNQHDNTKLSFGSIEYKLAMMRKYGTDNPMEVESIKQKIKDTLYKETGYSHQIYNPAVVEKIHKTNQANLRVNMPFDSEAIQQKGRATRLMKTGFEHSIQNPESNLKRIETLIRNTGVDNPMKDPKIREKIADALLINTGFSSTFANPAVRKKSQNTMLQRYGYTNCSSAPEIQERAKNSKKMLRNRPAVIKLLADLKVLKVTGKSLGFNNNWIHSSDEAIDNCVELIKCEMKPQVEPKILNKASVTQMAKRLRPNSILLEQYIVVSGKTNKELGISMAALRFNDDKLNDLCRKLGLI